MNAEAQSPRKPKEKIKPGIAYSLVATNLAHINHTLHQVGLVFDYKKVQLSVGGMVRFNSAYPWYGTEIGSPSGLYLDLHYAAKRKNRAFNFTFDFMATYLVSHFQNDNLMGANGLYVLYRNRLTEGMTAMGPGMQMRLIDHCTMRLSFMLPFYEYYQYKFEYTDPNGNISGHTSTSSSFMTPDLEEVMLKLGVVYVFSY